MIRYVSALLLLLIATAAVGQVAISQLPSATSPVSGASLAPIVQGSQTVKATLDQIRSTVAAFGAKCNGVTVDSAAFQAALNAGGTINVPAGATCIVGNLLQTNQGNGPITVLDCNGATLQAAPGSTWILKRSGVGQVTRNCNFNDPNLYNKTATTLSSGAFSGATTLQVASASGFAVGMPVNVLLASGAYWPSKIKPSGGISGTNITIVDPIPYSATAIAIVAGGSGCSVGQKFTVLGGHGPPATFHATGAAAGAITAAVLDVPGFYDNPPPSGTPAVSINGPGCTGVTVTLTTAGASNGASFEGSWGSFVLDYDSYGFIDNITMKLVYAGLGIYDTRTDTTLLAAQDNIRNININAVVFFGGWVDAGVEVSNINNFVAFGYVHGASNYGTVGFRRDYVEPTNGSPSGGNHFSNLTLLGFETGVENVVGNNDFWDSGQTSDTVRNYGYLCLGCFTTTWTGTNWNAFSGPSAKNGTGGDGGGLYFGWYTPETGTLHPAIANSMVAIAGGNNNFDLHFSDWYGDGTGNGASVWMNGESSWASSGGINITGYSAAISKTQTLLVGQSGPTKVNPGTAGVYIGAGGLYSASAEGDVATQFLNKMNITKVYCQASDAPGVGHSFTCNLRDTGTPTAGVAVTRASCTIPANGFVCEITSAIPIFEQDFLDIKVTSDSNSGPTPAKFWVSVAGI